MSRKEALSRHNLIIKKLRKHPATFNEISDYLSLESELQAYDFNVSARTFLRDREDIRSLYNIDIQYDFFRKVYFIDSEEKPEMNERILEAFDVFSTLNLTDRVSNYIHFEKRRPKGTENLFELLLAIKDKLQINFTYQKFWEEEYSHRQVEPYALKEFKNRWYVLSKDLKDGNVKTFALDRLTNLKITNIPFQYPADFQIEESFRYCFGIIRPNEEKPEDVILSFDPIQGKYILTSPLHHSQETLVDNKNEIRIKLKLNLTYDLIMELLSYGEYVKVIHPKALADEIKTSHLNAFNRY